MSENLLFETPRLRVRLLTMADFDLYFSLQNDAEVMRYIRPPEPDRDAVKARLETQEKYAAENPGMGSILGQLKTTGGAVATGVVRHIDYQPGNDLEIGYLIIREYWGQGLATELAAGLAKYAFEKFGVDRVLAVIDPENFASQKVVEKCGFQLIGRRFIYDTDNLEYVLWRD